MLQIDPADLPCLQKPGADIRKLQLIRILRAAGHQPSEEFFSWVNANELTEMNQLALALNNTTPHKLMRYLDQLFSKWKKDTYRGCAGVLSDYSDYLGFCEQLQYDLKNEFILFPKNFKRAHDQANDLIKQHRVEQYDPQIASMREKLKHRYQFKSDGLIVLPPRSAREIVVEGQKLHHCVGGYARSMAEKKTVILFIRQEAKRNKPFFTVEVQGDKIYQVRGSNNRKPVPKVAAFLDKWKQKNIWMMLCNDEMTGCASYETHPAMQRKDLNTMILTIPQRNSLVQEHLWCIDSVIKQNYSLIEAAHLDRDDVYQSLAVRLIRAVELYDPDNKAGKTLKNYIFMSMSLRYVLRTCGGSQARYGFREAPYFLPNAVVSMEALEEADPYWEMRIAA